MIKYLCDLCECEIDYDKTMYLQLMDAHGEINDQITLCPRCLRDYANWKAKKVIDGIDLKRKKDKE